jgi:hypothetical protein
MDTVRLPSILRKRTDSFVAGVADVRFQRTKGTALDRQRRTKATSEASEHVARDRINHGYGEPEGQPLTYAYPP